MPFSNRTWPTNQKPFSREMKCPKKLGTTYARFFYLPLFFGVFPSVFFASGRRRPKAAMVDA